MYVLHIKHPIISYHISFNFCFCAVVSEIQGNYWKSPIWAWNLAKLFQKLPAHTCRVPGTTPEDRNWAYFCSIVSRFQHKADIQNSHIYARSCIHIQCTPCHKQHRNMHKHHQIWVDYRLMAIHRFWWPSWMPYWIYLGYGQTFLWS